MSLVCMGHSYWVAMNILTGLYFTDNYMMFLIVLHMVCMGTLFILLGCLVGLLLSVYQAEVWKRGFGKTKYAESDLQTRIMLWA